MEPSRWELKIPLRVLCILSDDTERMGPPDLRAKGKTRFIQIRDTLVSATSTTQPAALIPRVHYHPHRNKLPVNENHTEH